MASRLEVYADVTCPFAHVGLKRVVQHVAEMSEPLEVVVRAWPLEWVNGSPLVADIVAVKAEALAQQLGVDDFSGFDPTHWPASTVPALELAAAAYEVDATIGLAVSLAIRAALFEEGRDVGDPAVLADIAAAHGVPDPGPDAAAAVRRDYDEGRARGVRGSPHFYVQDDDFFCPALDLGHDDEGHLTARFDELMLADFFQRIDA
jgi:predicted DsbA family dithiol-disulfide isomerase